MKSAEFQISLPAGTRSRCSSGEKVWSRSDLPVGFSYQPTPLSPAQHTNVRDRDAMVVPPEPGHGEQELDGQVAVHLQQPVKLLPAGMGETSLGGLWQES